MIIFAYFIIYRDFGVRMLFALFCVNKVRIKIYNQILYVKLETRFAKVN